MINTEKQKIHFNIGVAGFLSEEQAIPVYRQKITEALGQIKERVLYKEDETYSTSPNDVRIDFYTSPLIADKFWCDVCSGWNYGDLRIVLSQGDTAFSENRFYSTANTYKTTIANSLKAISQVNTMIDWITSQIDIAVALWDGNENTHNGHLWNFIEHCKKAGIPCIWIDTTDCENMNHYSGYFHIAEKILKVLKAYKARVVEILDARNENSSIPYERIRILADDTLDSLVNELYMWCGETVSHN